MSTSTIGPERKPLIDALLLQRRVLLGCTLSISVAIIVWIVAISTDHWFIVSGGRGIFVPETRRYFLSSHSGLWRLCRYSLMPIMLPNATVARNFTTISYTNITQINKLKYEISQEEYITQYLRDIELSDPITEINNDMRKVMFSHWVNNNTEEFQKLKHTFKRIVDEQNMKDAKISSPPLVLINSTNFAEINETIGAALLTVQLNGTLINIVVPEGLRYALFDEWEEKPRILYLLTAFAKDMEIPLSWTISNGTRVIVKPPPPPKKGKFGNGYEYKNYEICKYHDMFPTDHELRTDPSTDDELVGASKSAKYRVTMKQSQDYNRTEASFACICLFVMAMGFFFSIYTFMNPRYMFKRLASGIHFISASTCLVVIQVLMHAVDYEKENLTYNFPRGAISTYGYGFHLAWIVFIINGFSCLAFLWYSKKKKGNKAATDELAMADEPINIGR